MRALGIERYPDYLQRIANGANRDELVHLIDAISTNVTSFFREPVHFEILTERLREWYNRGQRKFRIWSAAASTGEEPYTLAMTVAEAMPAKDVDVRILATDISTAVLEKCRRGAYREDKLNTVPAALRQRYFVRDKQQSDGDYTVTDPLRRMLSFQRLNLSTPPFPMRGPFDAVFCRNVMIYFDNTVRRNLLLEIHRLLKPGGYLMVGHAESLTGIVSDFTVLRPSVYTKT